MNGQPSGEMQALLQFAEEARKNGWSSKDVREIYIRFFELHGHLRYPSSPVVPHGDNTLLFINAGMNQFKPIFLGQVDKNSPLGKLKRVVDTQKCIRAGGKHNDLDDVGKDEYHHTFFEMLGNWSFGDYFKKEAIEWAWILLTEVYKLPKDRLYATYFGGDPKLPLCQPDEEARRLWLQFLPPDRVLPFGAKENFWEMADTGPCGPCSEIHFDRIGGRNAASLVNKDDPSVLEIWNLVFMQFNRESATSLKPLPAPCVDTGMGLERLVSVLQQKKSNYDTDLFTPIFAKIKTLNSELPEYSGKVGAADVDTRDSAYRVLADHIRCLSVAITDGAEPSNEGRGYVLRRILRRAIRFSKQTLRLPEGSFPQLCDVVAESLGEVFEDLPALKERVKRILLKEEMQFTKTLDKGVERFNKALKDLPQGAKFPGAEAFTLYTTYGFPLDLTQLMAEEHGLEVDVEDFNKRFEAHRVASENEGFKRGVSSLRALPPDVHHALEKKGVPPTDDSFKYKWNIAQREYDPTSESTPCTSRIEAIWTGEALQESADAGETLLAFVLNQTPFYAEQGGQVGDTGFLHFEGGLIQVEDTQRSGSFVLHIGRVMGSAVKVGTTLRPEVNYGKRFGHARHHTATHLLGLALKEVLLRGGASCKKAPEGEEKTSVQQKGSLVEEQRLRFDFDWDRPLTSEELEGLELHVQRAIVSALPVTTTVMPLKDAMELPSLCALFGEVYPDPVRVVTVGPDVKELREVKARKGEAAVVHSSVELCGGTHVSNAAQLQDFLIISEESIAKGVRRIVAVTGEAARTARLNMRNLLAEVARVETLEPTTGDFEAEVGVAKMAVEVRKDVPLLAKRRALETIERLQKQALELSKTRAKALQSLGKELGEKAAAEALASQVKHLVKFLPELEGDGKALDAAAKALQAGATDLPFMLLTASAEKGTSAIAFTPGSSPLKSSAWLNSALARLGGKGGGKERSVGAAKDGNFENVHRAVETAQQFARQLGL